VSTKPASAASTATAPRRAKTEDLFFQDTGAPIRTLHYPTYRWRTTLKKLPLRYRKAYATRHTSVSWNLMLGKNPLRVAKEHGHSVATMWRVYAAWMDGAVEADIEAIRCAMEAQFNTQAPPPAEKVALASRVRRARRAVRPRRGRRRTRAYLPLDLPVAVGDYRPSPGFYWEITGGADGTRTRPRQGIQ
jgi:hypothetical protein